MSQEPRALVSGTLVGLVGAAIWRAGVRAVGAELVVQKAKRSQVLPLVNPKP